MTKRTATLASIPEREALLEQTLASLRPQVDEICVYLNGYERVPSFCSDCTVARSQEHGDRGDAGKFFWSAERKGWIFTCDDDLIYPPDYADAMVARAQKFQKMAVVAAHGGIFPQYPDRFLRGRRGFSLARELREPQFVNVVGTGVLLYHTQTIKVAPEHFKKPTNMADLWFAVQAQKQRVPLQVIEHAADWVRIQSEGFDTLYKRTKRDGDEPQREVLRKHAPWWVWSLEAWGWQVERAL